MHAFLLQDIKSIGKKGQIISVSPGFFRNYLFVKRLAIKATPDLRTKAEVKETHRRKKLDELVQKLSEIKKELQEKPITFVKKASAKGKLYGSIGEKEIVEAVGHQVNLELEPEMIKMEHHIKEVGEHTIKIRATEKSSLDLKIIVQKQEN